MQEKSQRARSNTGNTRAPRSRALFRELEVHREELSALNDELRRANLALVSTKERAARLYDVAPVGYFTLDAEGRIVEANLTGAALLRERRGGVFARKLEEWVAPSAREAFRRLRRRVLASSLGERFALQTVLQIDGSRLDVVVNATRLGGGDETAECLI